MPLVPRTSLYLECLGDCKDSFRSIPTQYHLKNHRLGLLPPNLLACRSVVFFNGASHGFRSVGLPVNIGILDPLVATVCMILGLVLAIRYAFFNGILVYLTDISNY